MRLAAKRRLIRVRPSRARQALQFAVYALRAELLRQMLGAPTFVPYSVTLSTAICSQTSWMLRSMASVGIKEHLQRASTFLIRRSCRLNVALVELLGGRDGTRRSIQSSRRLVRVLDRLTCLEANIHFPVDWVLLKDVALTLLKALQLIRKEGGTGCLTKQKVHPADEPAVHRDDAQPSQKSRKMRKKVLRKMKKLLLRIRDHARRHRDLLEARQEDTRYSTTARVSSPGLTKIRTAPAGCRTSTRAIVALARSTMRTNSVPTNRTSM